MARCLAIDGIIKEASEIAGDIAERAVPDSAPWRLHPVVFRRMGDPLSSIRRSKLCRASRLVGYLSVAFVRRLSC